MNDGEVRLVPMREVLDRKGKVLRYTHLPFPGSAEEWWEAGITAVEGKQLLGAATSYDTRLPQDSHHQPVEDKLRRFVEDNS